MAIQFSFNPRTVLGLALSVGLFLPSSTVRLDVPDVGLIAFSQSIVDVPLNTGPEGLVWFAVFAGGPLASGAMAVLEQFGRTAPLSFWLAAAIASLLTSLAYILQIREGVNQTIAIGGILMPVLSALLLVVVIFERRRSSTS